MEWTKEQELELINNLQDEYVNELIDKIKSKEPSEMAMKFVNFTSPTGTGKTKMMAKLINKLPNDFFIITTLSKGQLNRQVSKSINNDCKFDNYIVFGAASLKTNTILTEKDVIESLPTDKTVYWIRDEGHINTNKWTKVLEDRCVKIINFSATNKEACGIVCNFSNTLMLRTVNQNTGDIKDALNKLREIKKAHKEVPAYNPCALFRVMSKVNEKLVIEECESSGFKYITLVDNNNYKMDELCKDDSEYDVIINEQKLTEGIDIRRAHVIWIENQPSNPNTTIQAIGRCRRNALLWRDDINILDPKNWLLLEQTRECFVFYNVKNMRIDTDENGELQKAFCPYISVERLKPGYKIYVKNGQMPNGLFVSELKNCTGVYKIFKDPTYGFNWVKNPQIYKTVIKNDSIDTIHNNMLLGLLNYDSYQLIKISNQYGESFNKWIPLKSIISNVSGHTKLARFLECFYQKEISLAETQLYCGKNNFNFTKKMNSCLGYCVEYYAKYLLFGKSYLKEYITLAKKELLSKERECANQNALIVRACILKYRDNMTRVFSSFAMQRIPSFSYEQLSKNETKNFIDTIILLGKRTANFLKQKIDFDQIGEVDPVIDTSAFAGLMDILDYHTIIDIKCTNHIDRTMIRQVLAYQFLSKTRPELQINRVIVYDAVADRCVEIPICKENQNLNKKISKDENLWIDGIEYQLYKNNQVRVTKVDLALKTIRIKEKVCDLPVTLIGDVFKDRYNQFSIIPIKPIDSIIIPKYVQKINKETLWRISSKDINILFTGSYKQWRKITQNRLMYNDVHFCHIKNGTLEECFCSNPTILKSATCYMEGENKWICDICGKSFIVKSNTIDHIFDEKDVCIMCGKENVIDGLSFSHINNICSVHKGRNDIGPKIIIPKLHKGAIVNSIGSFSGCKKITDIIIPEGVKNIERLAFDGCSSLTSVTIPDSVTNIGDFVFSGCKKLQNIEIGSGLHNIDSNTFYCKSLQKIIVSDKNPFFESDDYGVLFDKGKKKIIKCPSGIQITKYIIPESVKEIEAHAFADCESIMEIVMPHGLKKIGNYAFGHCTNLIYAVIGESVTEIGSGVFDNCYSMIAIYNTSNVKDQIIFSDKIDVYNGPIDLSQIKIYQLDGCLFYEDLYKRVLIKYCGDKTSLILPESNKKEYFIGPSAFKNCKEITDIVIPKGVTSIGCLAFYGCTKLQTLVLPTTIESIGCQAFERCNKIKDLHFKSHIKYIDSSAFCRCTSLNTITFDKNVKQIGMEAFSKCSHLRNINIKGCINSIKHAAFKETSNIIVSINDLVSWCQIKFNSVDANPLHNHGELLVTGHPSNNLTLPSKIKTIGPYTFSGCTSIQNIFCSEELETIEADTFSNCENLKNIHFNEHLLNIKTSAFNNCRMLASIDFPTSLQCIKDYAFYGCASLSKVIISNSITELGAYAFHDCLNLVDIKIGTGLEVIERSTFYNCKNLKSITIPVNIKKIGQYAFGQCKNIQSINIYNNDIFIVNKAFMPEKMLLITYEN